MRKELLTLLCALLPLMAVAQTENKDFVKGADVGFLTGQEKRGVKFHDRQGRERECLELLKNDYQMNAIRMRVWVNPRGGTNDKNELLAMARRAKALGMDLMVDFHYSDSWADPAKQPIPQAWQGHSYKQMRRDLRQHTIEVLSLLKENGISPRWVQVGNETANGLLWPAGHIEKNPRQYAGFIREGYDAVKEVFPEAIVIIHLDRGHKQSLYDWNLDIVRRYGGKWDMVGMSLYPYWAQKDHPELKADDIITDCIANIRHVSERYGCDVMIVETGFEVDEQHPEKMEEGRRQLARIIREARNDTDGHCRGIFYWEPQCLPGGYRLGAFDSKAAPTAIMEGFTDSEEEMGAYLFTFFNDPTHSLFMAVSYDGYTFTAVNDGKPVIGGDSIAAQRGIRDPHICRAPNGWFYIAMTDLHVFGRQRGLRTTQWERDEKYGWGNNRGLVLMKSRDLIHWTHNEVFVNEAFPEHFSDLGCAWAPQTIWDPAEGKPMVYFTIRQHIGGRTKLFYSYANEDFTTLETEPQLLFEYPDSAIQVLDADICPMPDGRFFMTYVAQENPGGIKYMISDRINHYEDYHHEQIDTEPRGCEAPNTWKRIGEDKWVVMYDIYSVNPHNFGFVETSDFKTFTPLGRLNEGVMRATNFSTPKHGSVIQITKEEARRLEEYWK